MLCMWLYVVEICADENLYIEFVNCVSFRSLLRKECKYTVHEKCAQFYWELTAGRAAARLADHPIRALDSDTPPAGILGRHFRRHAVLTRLSHFYLEQ